MSKKKHRKSSFPAQIYVTRETDRNAADVQYLTADESPDAIEDGVVVGVYQLVETRRMNVTHELQEVG